MKGRIAIAVSHHLAEHMVIEYWEKCVSQNKKHVNYLCRLCNRILKRVADKKVEWISMLKTNSQIWEQSASEWWNYCCRLLKTKPVTSNGNFNQTSPSLYNTFLILSLTFAFLLCVVPFTSSSILLSQRYVIIFGCLALFLLSRRFILNPTLVTKSSNSIYGSPVTYHIVLLPIPYNE